MVILPYEALKKYPSLGQPNITAPILSSYAEKAEELRQLHRRREQGTLQPSVTSFTGSLCHSLVRWNTNWAKIRKLCKTDIVLLFSLLLITWSLPSVNTTVTNLTPVEVPCTCELCQDADAEQRDQSQPAGCFAMVAAEQLHSCSSGCKCRSCRLLICTEAARYHQQKMQGHFYLCLPPGNASANLRCWCFSHTQLTLF